MKIVSPQQMSDIESQAFHDGASLLDFMEEAGSGVALIAHDYAEYSQIDRQIVLLCGKGNNAGDAYVAGLHLLQLDYDVIAYQLFPIEECSNLCKQHQFQFINAGGRYREIESLDQLVFPESGLIIDGIFGTGFRGVVEEPIASVINAANKSKLPIVAIDIPSGLNGTTGAVEGTAIIATCTAFLGLPKIGFFLREGWNHVGKLNYVNFGLGHEYFESVETQLVMLSPDMLQSLLPPLVRNRHKYEAGHVVGLAGSLQFPGAALLASLSALCSGAGIVHLLYPEEMQQEMLSVPYELIKVPYQYANPEPVIELMNKASATFIGPGLGRTPEVKKLLKEVLPQLTKPCVIDADALNFLAEEKIKIPKQSMLTPHHGEMNRLLKIKEAVLDMDFIDTCRQYAIKHNVTLVLKGGPTFIFHGRDTTIVNPKGDPGMATAGTGDVLTGLLASLLAQNVPVHDAAKLGTYIHAVAGEKAAADLTSYCMTASDIITYFPDAFRPENWSI